MIVLMAGLPGTGKTTLAQELARRTSGRILSKDEIRRSLFEANEIEYSTRQDDFCLKVMLQTAVELLRRNRDLIIFLDGRTFSRRYQLDNVVNAAAALGQRWQIFECVCSEETAKHRLQRQTEMRTHPAENRNFQLYQEVRSFYEAITLPKLVIDTDQPLSSNLDVAAREILGSS